MNLHRLGVLSTVQEFNKRLSKWNFIYILALE